jgi:outer membrane lipoprotein-sorting protein
MVETWEAARRRHDVLAVSVCEQDMKSVRLRTQSIIALAGCLVLLFVSSYVQSSTAEKIKAEEVVAKHLESIGSAKARDAITTRIVSGTAQVIIRTTPAGQAVGKAVLASQGVKSLFGMSFPSPVYPREQLGFNGNNFMAAFSTPGVRSGLGNFLMLHDIIFKQGLMTGTLSSAWPLLDLAAHHAQVDYLGTRKVDDRVMHELRYVPRGNSDLKVTLFFDQETFRHVRTEYERTVSAPMGKVEYTNIQERDARYKMIEEFALFKPEGGLMLPHIYTIKVSIDTVNGTFLADWTIKLSQFEFNQKIDQSAFNVSAN